MVTLRSEIASAKFFTKLGYSTCWEDPDVLRMALKVTDEDTILSITSGGDLSIGLLLDNPKQVISIDLNPIQNYLLELQLACFKALSHPDMLAFLGVRPHADRLQLFEKIKPYLSGEARTHWLEHPDALVAGVLLQGEQDHYFFRFGSLLRLLFGNTKIDSLLGLHDPALQQKFFDSEWDDLKWQLLFDFFFSRRVMSFHMDPAHFRLVKNIRFGPAIRKQVDYIMKYSPMWENYFVHWVFTRSYPGEDCMPPYLKESNFSVIRSRLNRIAIVTSEFETFLTSQASASISRFNLSNIFDWIDNNAFDALVEEISRVAGPDSRLCYYNLLNHRRVSENRTAFRRQPDDASFLLRRNRAVGYTNFELYEVNPLSSNNGDDGRRDEQ